MQLYSTQDPLGTNTKHTVSFEEAVFQSMPADNGLFMPLRFPKLPETFFQEIADKYAGNESAIKGLVDKVIKGGSGVWGDLMMSPHPQLSEQETEKMIRYILSLNAKSVTAGLPYTGSYALNRHKPTDREGMYIFTASYTDKGSAGIKPLTATKVISLRYPVIGAEAFTEKKKAMTFLVTKELWKDLEQEVTIVMPNDGATVRYAGIDLTDVGQIKLGVAVAPNYFTGGTVEILKGGDTGEVIGSAELEVGLTDLGFKEIPVSIKTLDGVHDLTLRFRCKDPSKIFAGIATLEFIQRK